MTPRIHGERQALPGSGRISALRGSHVETNTQRERLAHDTGVQVLEGKTFMGEGFFSE